MNNTTNVKEQTQEEQQESFQGHLIERDYTDSENHYYLERHLFYEVVSNIVFGLSDDNYIPPNLEEQKLFFQREDVRSIMKSIVISFLDDLKKDEEWEGGMENDWIREYIYSPQGLSTIYDELPKVSGNSSPDTPRLLSISEYEPMFAK